MKNTQKHTQGPWMVSNGLPTVWANNGERQIADCDKGPLRSAGEDLANATLIALAPDLLEALYDALPCVEESEEFDKPHGPKLSLKIRALLAKAEGEE